MWAFQTRRPPTKTAPAATKKEDVIETESAEAQRRTFAASIIMSLADEARSYKDLALRAHVLAHSADTLWEVDSDAARTLFRQAWEAAEKADAPDAIEQSSNDRAAVIIIAMRRGGGDDSRSEVLSLVARRDRHLGEEFLAELVEATTKAAAKTREQNTRQPNDSWTTSDEVSKRLRVANRLLDERESERAFEFAAPVLDQVTEETISFLSRLRHVNASLADNQFMRLLVRAEVDPNADANTVSGLSSYAFTPGFYVTFLGDGGIRWAPTSETITAPDLPPGVKARFFRTSASILLRPSPPSDQDFTSAGLIGKYMIIKRLLPLFEQYAPDSAVALRSQLVALAQQAANNVGDEEHSLLSQGIVQEADPRTVLDRLQDRIDRARNDKEREEIYADAAAVLAAQGKPAAQDIADKIDNVYRREAARRYVDISLVRAAISKKDVAAALRFAKSDSLMHSHRSWAHLQIARLVINSDRTRAFELLEEALAEARRMDTDDPNRSHLMFGVARQFLTSDTVRPWEVASEAVKAGNAVEGFSGEDIGLSVALITSSGLKLIELDTSTLSLAAVFKLLAKQDLAHANDLAKSFRYEAPRAVATLAVASAALEKTKRI
jgi:hypothetical protein